MVPSENLDEAPHERDQQVLWKHPQADSLRSTIMRIWGSSRQ